MSFDPRRKKEGTYLFVGKMDVHRVAEDYFVLKRIVFCLIPLFIVTRAGGFFVVFSWFFLLYFAKETRDFS